MPGSFIPRFACACLGLLAVTSSISQTGPAPFPAHETLSYGIEWRLIYAGNARLSLDQKMGGWESKLHIESAGLVSKLYKLDDSDQVELNDQFCTTATSLDAFERSRHRETKVTYDIARGKASYVERDLLKNAVSKTAETDIPACVNDIIGAIYKLRTMKLEPGQNVQLPLSDGKKSVTARVEVQQREQLKTKAGTFNTIRCEAFVFNGVLFARKAELMVWLTDDARRIPVQIRARLNFPVGSITLSLEKEEHS